VIAGAGYRSLEYAPAPPRTAVLALAWLELRALFKRWTGVLAYVLCLGPSLVSFFLVLLQTGVWQLGGDTMAGGRGLPAELLSPRADPLRREFYVLPIVVESYVPLLALTALISCRAISKDRASGALELLWTRTLTPGGYFLGKWLGSVALLGIPAVVLPLFLWAFAVVSAPDWTVLETTAPFLPVVLGALALHVLVLTFLAVAFSAASAAPNFAATVWVMLVGGLFALGRALAGMLGEPHWRELSPFSAMQSVVEWVTGIRTDDEAPTAALGFLGAFLAAAVLVLWRRLRLREAIS
jgi:hypothetical protein